MKSRLDGYRIRRGEKRSGQQSTATSGVHLWELVVFWTIVILLIAVLFVPENPYWRYSEGRKAPDDYIARVDFTCTTQSGEPQVFQKGDRIVGAGLVVDAEIISQINAENDQWRQQNGNWKGFVSRGGGVAIIVIATLGLFIIFAFYLLNLPKPSPMKLLFLGSLFASAFLCGRLFTLFFPSVYWLFTPLALVAAIIVVAVGAELAATAVLCSTPIVLLTFWPHHEISIALISGAVIAPLLTRHARNRNHLLRAGLIIGAVNLVVAFSFGLIAGLDISHVFYICVAGLTSGIATGALITALQSSIEWLFGEVTDISLLELSDLNHPLLKLMLLEAPGTYQHSLLVATISEATAEAIGANALLCKVASLFHDIGKLVRPKYFVENNPGATALHGKLKYSMSALLIVAHVKDGIELAKQYNIPKPVMDIILEHQGTTLVEYFYRKALESGESIAMPDAQFFQYPGPKPRTREAVIVMIADSVEALTRSLKNPSLKRIQEAVHGLIQKKLADGQFNECNITIAELNKIEEKISWIVRSMFHQRIEYPGQNKEITTPRSPEGEIVREG